VALNTSDSSSEEETDDEAIDPADADIALDEEQTIKASGTKGWA